LAGTVYTDPGLMSRQIDLWDRPPNAAPALIFSGIYAQILGVSNTTQSPVAPALGQNTAWPRLPGPQISQITHQIVIRYLPGLKSRMYIVYTDPDNGPRVFDIDRIVDPDEHKVELRILAFERADGMDPFDAFLISTLDILQRENAPGDKRGISSPTLTPVASALPCRVAMGKVASKGKEERAKAKLALAYREVYLRPWFADSSPDGSFFPYTVVSGITYNTQPLTHNHFFLIPSASSVNVNNEPVPGELYDIDEINNPGLAHHHLEVSCQVILP
jgi:hypothetical protein